MRAISENDRGRSGWSLLRLLPAMLLALVPGLASAQLALPVSVASATLETPGASVVYTIDLDTLPARPQLIVDVEVISGSPLAEVEIELTNFAGLTNPFAFSGCPLTGDPNGAWTSGPGVGSARLEADLFFCDPLLNTWNGVDAEVIVRAADLGPTGDPIKVSVEIEGITFVPTELLLQQVSGPQSVTALASKGTVIYGDDFDASNGAGDFLWSGTYVVPFTGGSNIYFRYPRRSLLSFGSLASLLPSNAVVTDAELGLYSTQVSPLPPSSVEVFAITPGSSWSAGTADPPGAEFFGELSPSSSYVDWFYRNFPETWTTAGGDTTTASALASGYVSNTGWQTFSSPALAAAVQARLDTDGFFPGLLVSSPPEGVSNNGVQFASDDHPNATLHPTLTIDFDQPFPLGEGRIDPDLADFTDEGENFRWIYDTDEDGILVTPIGGVCESALLPGGPGAFTYPYTYSYLGTPGYTGLDCCTWRIFSDESQVVGTGQAVFFHNLDPLDPANLPADSDGDGILDLCDNCPLVANGPSMGSCMTPAGVNNGPCQSDLECSAGETCDLSQLDDDTDFLGNACAVPEPGFGLGLLAGTLWLGRGMRRRRCGRPLGPHLGFSERVERDRLGRVRSG